MQQCQQRPSLFVDNDVDSQEAYEEESLNSECTNPSVSACSAGMDNHSDDRQQPAGRNCQIVSYMMKLVTYTLSLSSNLKC